MNCSIFTFATNCIPVIVSLHSANYHRFIANMIDHCELHDCAEKKLHGQWELVHGCMEIKTQNILIAAPSLT